MVGNLSDCAFEVVSLGCEAWGNEARGRETYLTSANVEGRSTISAPPKSGVLVKDAIFFYGLSSGG